MDEENLSTKISDKVGEGQGVCEYIIEDFLKKIVYVTYVGCRNNLIGRAQFRGNWSAHPPPLW